MRHLATTSSKVFPISRTIITCLLDYKLLSFCLDEVYRIRRAVSILFQFALLAFLAKLDQALLASYFISLQLQVIYISFYRQLELLLVVIILIGSGHLLSTSRHVNQRMYVDACRASNACMTGVYGTQR